MDEKPMDEKLVQGDGRRRKRLSLGVAGGFLRLGVLLIGSMVVASLCAPLISPRNPITIDINAAYSPPSSEYLAGTDNLGRDVLSRTIYGARTALTVAFGAVPIAAMLGVPLGLLAAYAGRGLDTLIMGAMEVILAFPGRLLAIVLAAAFGGGMEALFVAIIVSSVPQYVRIVSASAKVVARTEYVAAARLLGAPRGHILFREILPNVAGPIAVLMSIDFAHAILAEGALSFLGLGVSPPTASWGVMLRDAMGSIEIQPWSAIVPGVALTITVLGFTLVAEGLRSALDQRGGGGSWR